MDGELTYAKYQLAQYQHPRLLNLLERFIKLSSDYEYEYDEDMQSLIADVKHELKLAGRS